jgi:hypothetical protein
MSQRSSIKPDQLLSGLKDVAGKLGIVVSEHRLSRENIKVRSGLCKIKGQYVVILDKQLPVFKKCSVLAACLSDMPHDGVFVVPAVRDFLARYQKPAVSVNQPSEKTDTNSMDRLLTEK